ncbi:MAG TPA: P-loop NTPase [Methanothrix sp.]|nr:P-loop NTPase [Methanothrix sp.]HPJ84367.1 P-loop NTPase [Methanothrix sp.]
MKILGFFGKGGTGKTTLTALILRELVRRDEGEVLAVDADANECLASLLGAEGTPTLSDMLQKYKRQRENSPELTGIDIFQSLFDALLMEGEQDGYDMLIMGRGEGAGCFCAVNDLLQAVFEKTVDGETYKYLLMDCEAGVEHIARKTSGKIHDAVIVTDASKVSLDTLTRIKDVASEVGAEIGNYYVVANKTRPEMLEKVEKKAESLGFKYLGAIPEDPNFTEVAYEGKTVFDLPDDSPAVLAAKKIADQILGS